MKMFPRGKARKGKRSGGIGASFGKAKKLGKQLTGKSRKSKKNWWEFWK